ncbi:Rha family transcriptional regulator [Sphingomonas sp. C8-2]|jgi:hypothetical protein|nr:Rha family transcriptional regulator [Sphingomonas sp. C8-2]QEH81165.1 Rha family transcriptional regulator [Sphingomonas sp. C8-2]
MKTLADLIIDALGGTTAVSRATMAPLSTVHSWRKKGIPRSRLAHLQLVAKEAGIVLPTEAGKRRRRSTAGRKEAA